MEVDFKESFCCCSNLSNDNIISAYASFKTGVDFIGGMKTDAENDNSDRI